MSQQKTKKRIEPFLKWAGGKSQLLKQFEPLFPKTDSYNRYIEPFVGGGAVFFYLEPREAIIADLNKDLINAYKVLKNHAKELIETLECYQHNHNKDFFLKIRDEYNTDKLDSINKAAHLIYLNKACFNGLYRVNKKGGFNVPFGQHKKFIINKDGLLATSKLLKHTKIENTDFENVLKYAQKGDFVYFDPPYYPLTKGSDFTSYTKENFLEKEQEKLANIFEQLDRRGCLLMLSNSDTKFIRNIYKKWNITRVSAKRFINCIAEKRGDVNEVVVRNYK
jgi:DNA adenine methylase